MHSGLAGIRRLHSHVGLELRVSAQLLEEAQAT